MLQNSVSFVIYLCYLFLSSPAVSSELLTCDSRGIMGLFRRHQSWGDLGRMPPGTAKGVGGDYLEKKGGGQGSVVEEKRTTWGGGSGLESIPEGFLRATHTELVGFAEMRGSL